MVRANDKVYFVNTLLMSCCLSYFLSVLGSIVTFYCRAVQNRQSRLWARSIQPKISVWITEIFVCGMERYFPPGWTDLALFPLGNISRQYLLDKMLKNDEVAVVCAVSCLMRRNLTCIHDYFKLTLPRYLPDRLKNYVRKIINLRTFLAGDYANLANAHGKFGATSP